MEGGIALRCFRMLLWVCILALVFSEQTTKATATIKILPESTTVPREGDSVTLQCKTSTTQEHVKLTRRRCLHYPQLFIVNENGLTNHTDHRFHASPSKDVDVLKITIDPVQQSDQGYYQCIVKGGDFVIARSAEILLLVYHPDEFPVCTPDGPATGTIWSSLSCKTLSYTRTPLVSDMGMPTVTNDGLVTNSEHGNISQCYSTINVSAKTLPCTIDPLKVVCWSPTFQTNVLTATTLTLIVSIVILIIIIILLLLCCHYDPRRWQQVRGMLGRSSTPRQGKDRNGNGPERGYETPSAVPRTATPGTTSSTPATTRHVYQNEIAEHTSSS